MYCEEWAEGRVDSEAVRCVVDDNRRLALTHTWLDGFDPTEPFFADQRWSLDALRAALAKKLGLAGPNAFRLKFGTKELRTGATTLKEASLFNNGKLFLFSGEALRPGDVCAKCFLHSQPGLTYGVAKVPAEMPRRELR